MDEASIFPIPLDHMTLLRRLLRPDAEKFLDEEHPELSAADREAMLKMTIDPHVFTKELLQPSGEALVSRAYVVDPARNLFIVAATQAGASQYQLGRLFSLARGTMYQILRRYRTDELRTLGRLNKSISYERLGAMKTWFDLHKSNYTSSTNPQELAQDLLANSLDAE